MPCVSLRVSLRKIVQMASGLEQCVTFPSQAAKDWASRNRAKMVFSRHKATRTLALLIAATACSPVVERATDSVKFAPHYGGYCAWAIGANDALAPGDPNVYKIVVAKLFLNFSEGVTERWHKDIPGFIMPGLFVLAPAQSLSR